MIDLAFEYFLKVFVLVIILRALRVFDIHSVLAYVLFCSVSFFAAPTRLMPEFLVFCIFLFLFLYVILVSLRNSLRTGFLRFLRHAGGLFYSKKNIFYSVFLICFFMMASGVENRIFLFFGSFFGFLFMSWAARRVNVQKYDKYGVISFRNAAIVSAVAGLYYSQFVIMIYSIVIGLVYLALFVVFSFVSDTFTFECPVGGLKEGMISAEYVVKKGNRYYRKSFHSITPQSFLRGRIMLKMDKESVVVSPLRALTSKDVDFLKKMDKSRDFDSLHVQDSVDMRMFVVLGIAFAILVRFFVVV